MDTHRGNTTVSDDSSDDDYQSFCNILFSKKEPDPLTAVCVCVCEIITCRN